VTAVLPESIQVTTTHYCSIATGRANSLSTSTTNITLPLAAQTQGRAFAALVAAIVGIALLCTAVLLVVKFTLVLRNKRRHRSAFLIDHIDYTK